MPFGFFKNRRRKAVATRPFPDAWLHVLEERVPIYGRLRVADREELKGHIQIFLDEKRFEGALGLEVTDEMRVAVAAQASILLLHRETDYYPGLDTIVLYPSEYVSRRERRLPGGIVESGPSLQLGESSSQGAIVLSWDGVVAGAAQPDDGKNLVFHEFAHQLDQESGDANGAPVLEARWMYKPWAEVLGREYRELVAGLEHGRRDPLIDPYGATNPAEFFAVVSEVFFERPKALEEHHPDLYEQLAHFYAIDPLLDFDT